MPRLPSGISAVASVLFLASPLHAYNSEEHKLLVDRGASKVRIDPSIQLPAPTGMITRTASARQLVYSDTKYFAVGFRTTEGTHKTNIKGLQDNSYWTGWDQAAGNVKIYIPDTSQVSATTLEVAGWTGAATGTPPTFTMGELAAIYGDYRRTVFCVIGNCYLTDADAPTLGFALGTDCFGPPLFQDCGWRPAAIPQERYLRYIASGLWPPWDPPGPNTATNDLNEAVWWGDEMLRIALSNDWHFSSAAVAWYVGCHRLALYYASLARTSPAYWNQALHYEAHGLHSLTDLFAFGHVVTNADQRTYGILENALRLGHWAYAWGNNVYGMAGATRDNGSEKGRVKLGTQLPAIADQTRHRNDLIETLVAANRNPVGWAGYALQEKDFHDCFNLGGGTVRNLAGDSFTIFGDGDIGRTTPETQAVIVEAVRASIQSLFDGYVEMGRGRTPEQVSAVGSPFYAALRKLPVFIVKNPEQYCDLYFANATIGNNYNGKWTLYAEYVDVISGANIVPDGTPCVMPYEWGANTVPASQVPIDSCSSFPATPAPPPGGPPTFDLEQSFPNPFAASTTIRFRLPRATQVVLEVFDLRGRRVRTLVREQRPEGNNFVIWDGTSDKGARVAGGLYFYKLSIDGESRTKAMSFAR